VGDGAQLCVKRYGDLVTYCAEPEDLDALGIDLSRMAVVACWLTHEPARRACHAAAPRYPRDRDTSPERTLDMDKTKAIHNAVKAGLRVNPLVNDSGITVMNMDGDVTLTGVVTSYPEYLEAAAVARRVAGVKNVHNHLEVVLLPHVP